MPKPRQGKEVKVVKSIRLEPNTLKKIIKKYGTLTGFIKAAIDKLL